MSMGQGSGGTIPAETVRVARAANPKGTPAMWVRDRLDELFVDADFADWYPLDGRRGVSPAVLALVSVLQYAENLTDRQAARAVACRIDWKYALGMELTDAGFDYSVLSEFRDRLAADDRADRLFAVMIGRLVDAGLVKRRGRQRTDSTHVLAAVRRLNRVELVAETLRVALEALAVADDAWLATVVAPGWGQRYGRPIRHERLPSSAAALADYVEQVAADGAAVLEAVSAAHAPAVVRSVPQVDVLRQVWLQQFFTDHNGRLRWRQGRVSRARQSRQGTTHRSPPTAGADVEGGEPVARVPWARVEIVSPHDPEARYSCKVTKAGTAGWVGYKDHQTETCDDDDPNVIVHVLTTPAPEQDTDALDRIHTDLDRRDLAPGEHLVDSGYLSPDVAHRAATEHDITMLGPIRLDPHADKRPGFTQENFHIDWDQHTATCPQGVTSLPWHPITTDRRLRLTVQFPLAACRQCPVRLQCTGTTDGKARRLVLMPRPQHDIQTQARAEQQTPAWQQRYAIRAGAEATISETVRAHGLRHCRYHGLAKTHVQHVLTAAGTNIIRLSEHPPGHHRRPPSHLHRLCRALPAD